MPSEARAAGPAWFWKVVGCGVPAGGGRESLKCQLQGTDREDPIQLPSSQQLLWEAVGLGPALPQRTRSRSLGREGQGGIG